MFVLVREHQKKKANQQDRLRVWVQASVLQLASEVVRVTRG